MFLTLHRCLTKQLLSQLKKMTIANTERMNQVFVRHLNDEDVMKVSFTYGDDNFPPQEFNFLRLKNESLGSALKRMKFKIESAMSRRTNKKKKGNKHENNSIVLPDFYLLKQGVKVDVETSNIEVWREGTQLIINDVSYEIIQNAPIISSISLSKNIMSGFLVYPEVHLEFCTQEESDFTWYRSVQSKSETKFDQSYVIEDKNGEQWVKVGEGFFYMVSKDDVDSKLMSVCIPKSGTVCGKEEQAILLNPVKLGPEQCPFQSRHEHTKDLTNSESIRCVSYNILADLYAETEVAQNELFPYCPPEFLKFEYRKQLYLKELLGYNGDLMCLQEVDRKAFKKDLLPVLSASGLVGVFNEKGNQLAEGLACFYRSNKFRLLESTAVLLSDVVSNDPAFEDLWNKISENEKLKERISNRTTALQIVVLECTHDSRKQILMGNTHLYFHPDSDNIRLIQGAICARYLESARRRILEKNPNIDVAVLFCGDFNSCPEFGLYQLLTAGNLPASCVDWKSNEDEVVEGLPIQHSLSLSSACGTPSYTNFTAGFVGCLDYIFYDRNHFEVKEVIPLPEHDEVVKLVALPNQLFPSDHLALVCVLKYLK